jgi:hypothetical protein
MNSRQIISDSPTRVGTPDHGPDPIPFEDYAMSEQLDAADIACRRERYRQARSDALPESDQYQAWLVKLMDSSESAEVIVREARQIVLAQLQASAELQGEDMADFL